MNLAVAVYEKLKPKIGEDGANALLDYVDSKIEETAVTKLDLTKTENNLGVEIHNLGSKIQGLEGKLEVEIQGVKSEIKGLEGKLEAEIQRVEGKLEAEIQGIRSEIQRLEGKLGTEIKRLEDKLDGAIQQLRAEMREMEARLRVEIRDVQWKTKLYFGAIAALIIITNPRVMDMLAKLLGIIK
ncbi:MAG: hypothetical protein AB1797_03805 [bacterium]